MRIFVTGATGFIGSRLIERLVTDNHKVKALVRNPGKDHTGIEEGMTVIEGDIEDIAALASGTDGCQLVFHLAAYTGPWSQDLKLPWKINVDGTRNVMEAARDSGVKRVVFTS